MAACCRAAGEDKPDHLTTKKLLFLSARDTGEVQVRWEILILE